MTQLLFVHGAGGYVEDRLIADGLASRLGADVEMPHLPDDDMSFEAWAEPIRRALDAGPDIVVGHSFGASVLLHLLDGCTARSAALLAAPEWSPSGWAVADYAYYGPEPDVALSLYHCRDDEEVPFEHLALYAAALLSAQVYEHPRGGHQFVGTLDAVASGIRHA